jgi:uncharacterized protein
MNCAIQQEIQSALDIIEQKHEVTVLYACESGSRAWGFESKDSDYDIRFIYLNKTPWYLKIAKGRDVIEEKMPNDLDISGWELAKALELFRKSNPPLLEWFQSPIVYRTRPSFIAQIRELLPHYYAPVSCMHHYLHMADGNMREYLKGDEVWTKKYFYVLRPVLACLWIEKGLGIVPTEFQKLVDATVTDSSLRQEIDLLLALKKTGEEMRRGPRNPIISAFLENHLARLNASGEAKAETKARNALDNLFLKTLIEVNGNMIELGTAPL